VIVLVVGGVRSGKSDVAERVALDLAHRSGDAPVTYLATAVVAPDDREHAARVAAHRLRRPPTWTTGEVGGDLPAALAVAQGIVLVDSLGAWVAAHPELAVDVDALVDALATRPGPTIVVTEEVGLSVHAATEAGRRFQDVLGALNRAVADRAERVLLVVAGRVLELPPAGAGC
jgi:adenosylcobinamide kinase/adenosylcobinamide-phosphate guanylyltransferase